MVGLAMLATTLSEKARATEELLDEFSRFSDWCADTALQLGFVFEEQGCPCARQLRDRESVIRVRAAGYCQPDSCGWISVRPGSSSVPSPIYSQSGAVALASRLGPG